jgi:hypothetical protein
MRSEGTPHKDGTEVQAVVDAFVGHEVLVKKQMRFSGWSGAWFCWMV